MKTEKRILLTIRERAFAHETVGNALKVAAACFGCKPLELTCRDAGPTDHPEFGEGITVLVYRDDPDAALSMYVPASTALVWNALGG